MRLNHANLKEGDLIWDYRTRTCKSTTCSLSGHIHRATRYYCGIITHKIGTKIVILWGGEDFEQEVEYDHITIGDMFQYYGEVREKAKAKTDCNIHD